MDISTQRLTALRLTYIFKQALMKKTLLTIAAIGVSTLALHAANPTPAYLDPTRPLEERVEDALSRMTLEEKVGIIHAQSKFSSAGVPRLGIPEVWTTDGPHGIRPEVLWDQWKQASWTNDSCTAFPALTCLAATWNPEMAALYGTSIGEEARYRRKDVLLGPGVNINRTPLNGRNFEYMGEDPYLASRMVVPYVKGVQSNGVAACVKHYALNNHETNRHTTNVIVDDRALREIYLPAFKAAVQEGGAWAIMGSYNLYNNEHCCHNQRLLNDILKGEWGFDGVVISDWGGTHDTEQAITNGLDMEFGTWTNGLSTGAKNAYLSYHLANPYLDRLKLGKASAKVLDEKARRVLRLMFRTNMNPSRPYGSMCSPAHVEAARQIADEGIVLLKNDRNILPLDFNKVHRVAVIGENAIKMMTVGGGSSSLKARYEVSPLEGIKKAVGNRATVEYSRGYIGDTGDEYDGVTTGQNLKETRDAAQLQAEAVDLARNADVVIFVGGLNKASHQDCEDTDRKGLELPYNQDQVIKAISQVNPNVVVVNVSGNAVAMPWVKEVPAILQAWYLGTESGNAIADVLTGRVNPSGKLPITFPVRLEDLGSHSLGNYLGTPRNDEDKTMDCNYSDGLFVGYRWTDAHKITPLFPFGHGLSYTTFTYGKPSLSSSRITADGNVTVTIPVTNSGSRDGAEVVQLYIQDVKSTLPRPVKELKGFKKIYLRPGESTDVKFSIDKDALSYFNPDTQSWVCEPGAFRILIGSSSSDIRSQAKLEVVE